MKTFWDTLGRALAKICLYAGKGALAVSEHPQVVADIATLAGKPQIAAVITEASPLIEAGGAAIAAATQKH